MDITTIIDAVLADLALVALSQPNERLPKEEQIRCSIYAAIRPLYSVVCAERGYSSIDAGSRIECDLWASSPGQPSVWIEFKRGWSGKGWVNKPPDQLSSWEADVDKLRRLDINSDRYFVLVGLFDCDPLCAHSSARCDVANNIRSFYRTHLVHSSSKPFTWRESDGMNCIGAWVWHWPNGAEIRPAVTNAGLEVR
jgi:hypothetical protein